MMFAINETNVGFFPRFVELKKKENNEQRL